MPDSETAVAPQPEVKTQTGGEKNGPANLSGQALAHRFFQREVAQIETAKKAADETAAEETPQNAEVTAATGEAQADPAEVKTETTEAAPAAEEVPAETDEVLSPETQSLDPKLQAKIDRRIGKEVAKRKALEQRIQELEQKLVLTPKEEPEKAEITPLPSGAPPLANVNDLNGLVQLQQQAKAAIRWGEEQLDREDFDINPPLMDNGQPFARSQIKAAMRNARVVLEDQIPQRAQFINARQQFDTEAQKKFPYLKDKSSIEYQHAQQIVRERPWLNSIPERDWLLGVHIEGLKAIEAREAAAKKAAEKKPAPKPKTGNSQTEVSVDSTSTRVPVTTQVRQQLQAASEKLKAKGSVTGKEYAAHLALQSQLRQSR